jgi:Holliday junction resolvase
MPSPQKAKGSSWERDVAVYLSNLYGESFIRAPGSGAYIGGSNTHRKEYLDEGQIRTFKGDIVPGKSFPRLNIECKSYKDFPFNLLYTSECKVLDAWLDQLLAPADATDINILAMKFNRKGKFIAYEHKHRLINYGNNYTVYKNSQKHHGPWIILEFNTFWQLNKQTIKELSCPSKLKT